MVNSWGWLGVHTKELALKLHIDMFILGQCCESWHEISYRSYLGRLRDFGTTIFSSISTKPRFVLNQRRSSQKSPVSVSVKECLEENLYLSESYYSGHFNPMHKCGQVTQISLSALSVIALKGHWVHHDIYFVWEVDVLKGGTCGK